MVDANTRRKFEALVSAAFIDGFLALPEKEVLREKAAAMNIPSREMNEIIAMGEQRKLSVSVPAGASEREALLEDLIDVVIADGRVEAPEYHLLARFAETMKIALPELRMRVNRSMQARSGGNAKVEPRRETVRAAPRPPQATAVTRRPESPPPQPPPPPVFEAERFSKSSGTVATQGPIQAQTSFPKQPMVADLPPVTLQLLKQSIMFDNEADSIITIGRTLGIPPGAATDVRNAILAAYPDLKPGSQQIRTGPR
jgi:uncharacterized tellurite resistance protein B-like protein